MQFPVFPMFDGELLLHNITTWWQIQIINANFWCVFLTGVSHDVCRGADQSGAVYEKYSCWGKRCVDDL